MNIFKAYAKAIVLHTYLILCIVVALCTVLTITPFLFHSLPTFSDPIAGFETRGTLLSQRFVAWENLVDETRPSGKLAGNPRDIEDQLRFAKSYNDTSLKVNYIKNKTKEKEGKHKKLKGSRKKNEQDTNRNGFPSYPNIHWTYGNYVNFEKEGNAEKKGHIRNKWVSLKNMDLQSVINIPGSCGAPLSDYAHLVVSSTDGSSLLTYENIMNMCEIQSTLANVNKNTYVSICERPIHSGELCCPPWSIPNYLALLFNKTSCFNLTHEDISKAIAYIQDCASYFHSLKLAADCELDYCSVPAHCAQHNAIYNLLYYHIDTEAFPQTNLAQTQVKHAMIFLPLPPGDNSLSYYLSLSISKLSLRTIEISAMDFGLKDALFDLRLLQDTWLIALGGLFVFICVWIYCSSVALTLVLFVVIFYSIGISYFLYTNVYGLDFFPFMNLLVIVIVIGIGADDSFIFVNIWKMVGIANNFKSNWVNNPSNKDIKNEALIEILEKTMRECSLTMTVTTLTTAIAFLASWISYIPAINCFSIFAGTAVLVNFVLIIVFLPAIVLILEAKCNQSCHPHWFSFFQTFQTSWLEALSIFQRFIVFCITKFYVIFVLFLGSIGILSGVIMFYYPGLQLPDSKHFQLFNTKHLFEQYDLIYKDKFMFERFTKGSDIGNKMPLRWVWGIKAIDNGNHMNPYSTGKLVLNNDFSISNPESQIWLKDFCSKLKKQPFYYPTPGLMLPNCFIESFIAFMARPCIEESSCCENSNFPFTKETFDECILLAVESLYQTPRDYFIPGVAGPKFLRNSTPPTVVALVVEYESVVTYSMSYKLINNFYEEVENWTQHQLKTAPPGMKDGWFISDLQFYDLQNTLANGTVVALILSSLIGLIILIPSTWNLVASISAVISMTFCVSVTISCLLLLGWKLNVLESIAISTSAGLAVDFNLHYALSYVQSTGSRQARVASALSTSSGPTAAAALTTGFAGIFLLSSAILPYFQIGTFLAIIMFVSWIYSTFFLCSLLRLIGKETQKSVEVRTSRISSLTSGIPNVEIHELQHLTSNGHSLSARLCNLTDTNNIATIS